jgi:hypothetical protein
MKPPSAFFSGIVISWPTVESVGPGGRRVLDAQPLVAADEVAVVVADQPAGQQVRLDEDLEAVADAEHRHPGIRRRDDLAHDRRAGAIAPQRR